MIENYILIQGAMRFLLFNSIVSYVAWDSRTFISALVIIMIIFILVVILLIKELRMKYKRS